jgi:AraC-like DNA-binding protein
MSDKQAHSSCDQERDVGREKTREYLTGAVSTRHGRRSTAYRSTRCRYGARINDGASRASTAALTPYPTNEYPRPVTAPLTIALAGPVYSNTTRPLVAVGLRVPRAAAGASPVGAVAAGVGYESEAAFCRAFRKVTGVTPASWRSRRRVDGSY